MRVGRLSLCMHVLLPFSRIFSTPSLSPASSLSLSVLPIIIRRCTRQATAAAFTKRVCTIQISASYFPLNEENIRNKMKIFYFARHQTLINVWVHAISTNAFALASHTPHRIRGRPIHTFLLWVAVPWHSLAELIQSFYEKCELDLSAVVYDTACVCQCAGSASCVHG